MHTDSNNPTISEARDGLFSLHVEPSFLKPISYCAKGCNHDCLVVKLLFFCEGMRCKISTSILIFHIIYHTPRHSSMIIHIHFARRYTSLYACGRGVTCCMFPLFKDFSTVLLNCTVLYCSSQIYDSRHNTDTTYIRR